MNKFLSAAALVVPLITSGPLLTAASLPAHANEAAGKIQKVNGPEVSVTANWNQDRSATGVYTAPPGFKILQVKVHVLSDGNGGSYRTKIVGNQASVIVSAQGSHKFYDQYRGWIHVQSTVTLEKVG